MVDYANPFSLVRASDITDAQINSLWVELGPSIISAVMEPTSTISKYILGGKGTGKTHLLRYHSYQVARLRNTKLAGLAAVRKMGYLAVFLRATALDAARFEIPGEPLVKWQTLFGVYLELRLTDLVLDSLQELRRTSLNAEFDDAALIQTLSESIDDEAVSSFRSIEELRDWIDRERRKIDHAVNNAAFTGSLNVRIPFSIGALSLQVKRGICAWNKEFKDIPLLFMLDEVENFSLNQQMVVNSLVRYGEGLATFRISGRLYAVKTHATIGGEVNREGSEFKILRLDDLLTKNIRFKEFATKFVQKRLGYEGVVKKGVRAFDPAYSLEEIDSTNFFEAMFSILGLDATDLELLPRFLDSFSSVLLKFWRIDAKAVEGIGRILTSGFPLILQRLNILLFCKKLSPKTRPETLAKSLASQAKLFFESSRTSKSGYANAYSHYKWDLFAQICRESNGSLGVPYAGFDTFVQMACGNPRNLLIILGRIYEIAAFREINLIGGAPVSIALQTVAAAEAARFMFERDANFGASSDSARVAVERLATLLRAARFALRIPEVSPLAVSFSNADLSKDSHQTLEMALKYSFLFEVDEGRPDRNSDKLNRKVQLNPMLSPRWELPIGRRGDISLSSDILNSIFDSSQADVFDQLLRGLVNRWNRPGLGVSQEDSQGELAF